MPKRKHLVLLTLSLLIFQLSFEVAFRIYLFGFDSLDPFVMNSLRPMGAAGLIQASEHREILYEFEPNLDTHHKKVRFETNSVGLRDREYSIEKPAGTFRVVVVGDSFTVPSGVAIEDAFHSLLEERLSGGPSQTPHEFINFAVGGYGPRQYLGVLEHKALAYDPDLILVGFCPFNDFSPLPEWRFDRPYVPKPLAPSPFLTLHSWPEAWRMLRTIVNPKGDLASLRLGLPKQEYVAKSFARLAELGRREGIPVVVANLSFLPSPGDTLEVLERETASAGLPLVVLERSFDPDRRGEYVIYRQDAHPNRAAHAVFADALYDFLVANALVRP